MKKFCTSSREYATNVINFEKTKMLPLTKKRAKITPRYMLLYQILANNIHGKI